MGINFHRDRVREEIGALTPPRNDLLPKLKLKVWRCEDLSPPKRRVRRRLTAQIARVQTSIEAFGLVEPLLVRKSGEIIGGVARYEAAKALGLEEVPCIEIDHLTETEVRALRLALNRIGEQGEFDIDQLQLEIGELTLLGAPLEATGFTLPELDALRLDDGEDPALDALPDETGLPQVTQPGDVWRCGAHLVVCSDARDPSVYLALMKDELAQLVLTDEPYNVPIKGHVTSGEHAEFAMATGEMTREAFGAFNADWIGACLPHLKPGGLLATFIDWRSVDLVIHTGKGLGLELLNFVVWAKTNGGQGGLWRSQHELLPVFKKPGAAPINNVQLGRHGRYRTNLWQYPGASSLGSDARKGLADHPTVKPVALLEDALLDVTNPGDLVIDPFGGSGSTLLACERTGRRCRMIELEPKYVDLIVRRWQDRSGKFAVHHETGESFNACEEMALDAATAQRTPSDPEGSLEGLDDTNGREGGNHVRG